MAEKSVIISTCKPKGIQDLPLVMFDLVVTLCGDAAETCPYFPDGAKVEHHGLYDPPKLTQEVKNEEEALRHYRRIRDEIADYVSKFPLLYPELFAD